MAPAESVVRPARVATAAVALRPAISPMARMAQRVALAGKVVWAAQRQVHKAPAAMRVRAAPAAPAEMAVLRPLAATAAAQARAAMAVRAMLAEPSVPLLAARQEAAQMAARVVQPEWQLTLVRQPSEVPVAMAAPAPTAEPVAQAAPAEPRTEVEPLAEPAAMVVLVERAVQAGMAVRLESRAVRAVTAAPAETPVQAAPWALEVLQPAERSEPTEPSVRQALRVTVATEVRASATCPVRAAMAAPVVPRARRGMAAMAVPAEVERHPVAVAVLEVRSRQVPETAAMAVRAEVPRIRLALPWAAMAVPEAQLCPATAATAATEARQPDRRRRLRPPVESVALAVR